MTTSTPAAGEPCTDCNGIGYFGDPADGINCKVCKGSGVSAATPAAGEPSEREAFRVQRPACADCSLPYTDHGWADFVVADETWAKLTGSDPASLLCACCMIRRAYRLGISAPGRFTSGPFCDDSLDGPIPASWQARAALNAPTPSSSASSEREAPFKGPFRVLHRTENYSPVAEVLDADGWVVSSLLSPHKAQWLCDHLNAKAQPVDSAGSVLTEEERTLYERCAERYPACSTSDVGDLLSIISRAIGAKS